jgi:protein-S-isoprenylcysteine O-methyltransferase Ste14
MGGKSEHQPEAVEEMAAPPPPKWIASWIATGLIIGQIILLIVLGEGDIAWIRYTGLALWLCAAVLGWLPIYEFKKYGGVARGDSYMNTTRLVDRGLYAVVRHPQFVAWPIMAVAVAAVSQHPLVMAVGAVAAVLAVVDFRKVDVPAIEKFGEDYRRYMERVPGWNLVAGVWRWLRRR